MMDNKNNLPDLPKGWVWATTNDVIGTDGIFTDGDWIESKDQDSKGNVRLIQLADIGDGYFKDRSDRYLTLSKANELNCTFLRERDVLIARMPDPLGRACIFPLHGMNCFVTAVDVAIVRTGSSGINEKYFMNIVNTPQIRSTIERLQTGTTRKRISKSNLATINIPLPPLPEQQRIVAKIEELFTRLDAGTAALKKVKAELKRYRQAVLKYAFEGKLTAAWREANKDRIESASVLLERIQEERKKAVKGKFKELPPVNTSSLPELPGGWKWTSLEHIIASSLIGLVRSSGEQNKEAIGYPYIKMNNITMGGKVILDDLVYVQIDKNELDQYEIKENDILFNTRNSLELVGKTGLVQKTVKKHVFNNNLMRIRVTKDISPSFMVYQLCSPEFRNRMEMVKRSTTNVAALYAKDVMPLPVIVPSSFEQNQIVQEIERRFSVADEVEKVIEQSLKQSERLRQSILKKAFEGKLVPQDSSDEPAYKLLERIKAEKAKLEAEVKVKKAAGKKPLQKKASKKQGRLL